jgi:hypothetical protein
MMPSRNGTHTPTPQQAARQLWELGANVTSIPAGGKEPAHEWNSKKAPWATERQDLDIVNSLPWNTQRKVWRGRIDPPIETVGIISGPGGWRCLDIDPRKDEQGNKIPVPVEVVHAVRSALGLPDGYPWQGPSRSGAGWHVWFRCDDELPPELAAATNSKESGVKIGVPLPDYASAFDHIELRWERCQTVLPAPSGYNGCLPSEPPARVDIDQARAAFLAIATPKRKPSAPDSSSTPHTAQTAPKTVSKNILKLPSGGRLPTQSSGCDWRQMATNITPCAIWRGCVVGWCTMAYSQKMSYPACSMMQSPHAPAIPGRRKRRLTTG